MKATLLEQMKRDYIYIKQTKTITRQQVERQEEVTYIQHKWKSVALNGSIVWEINIYLQWTSSMSSTLGYTGNLFLQIMKRCLKESLQ